jgi:hypothetical protein
VIIYQGPHEFSADEQTHRFISVDTTRNRQVRLALADGYYWNSNCQIPSLTNRKLFQLWF